MAVVVIDTIKPKNNGTFPVVEAVDVKVTNSKRLDAALNDKANQSDVTALQSDVNGKASQADLNALSSAVAGKQNALTTEQLAACNSGITSQLVTQIGTNTTAIAGKASASDLATTNATVATKANASDVATADANLQAQIDNIVSGSTADSEVINARVGADSTSYNTLKSRLDAESIGTNGRIDALCENGIYNLISGYVNGYGIDLTGTVADLSSPVSSYNTRYVVYPCKEGDTVYIHSHGANLLRAYAFLDSSNNILEVANPNAQINTSITAPYHAAKVVINNSQGENYNSYIGTKTNSSITRIIDNLTQSAQKLVDWDNGYLNYSFRFEIDITRGGFTGQGEEIDSTIRGRSEYYDMFAGASVVVPAGYEARAAFYLGRTFKFFTDWTTSFIPIGYYLRSVSAEDSSLRREFRILIRKIDNSTISNGLKVTYCGQRKPANNTVMSDKLMQVNNGYAVQAYGLLVDNDYVASMPIPVVPNKEYKCGAVRNYVLYDSDLKYITSRNGSGGMLLNTNDCDDAAYVVFCWRKDDGITSMSFAESDKYIGGEYLTVPVDTSTLGKKIIWTGDSIPHGQVASGTTPSKPYPQIVAENLGMTLINYSIGGSTLAKKPNYGGAFDSVEAFNAAEKDTSKYYQVITGQSYTSYKYSNSAWVADSSLSSECRTPIVERFKFMSDDADIICVAAGTNDFQYNWTDIGNIAEVGSVFDKTTLYGALQFICENLLIKYMKKTIIFFTPIKRAQTSSMTPATGNGDYPLPTSQNTKGKTLKDYGTIIKEVCDLYSIPVIDLYSISGLNPSLSSQSVLFDSWKTHPFQSGHNMLGRVCTGQIKSLIKY